MKFKWVFLATSFLMALNASGPAQAQVYALEDPADWKEIETPPPPAFDIKKLITLEVSPNSQLVYGVDPATISISPKDGIVRYVMVASNASGARNVMYEGIRCSTGEFKTYARYSPDGKWTDVSKPEWRSLFENMPSKHALRFARAGACDSAAPATSVDTLVRRLKNQNFRMVE
ncbi:CNP1-like family protein [Polaromonas sp. JS666]|uniref:CNP1-like family protein n=1 Tax=Polaromonas sp. (strain JS666 / ATCC BAA-500) TaxID=296591 RepID=UPI0008849D80|nr:CNP1-like family protein [Polaromonas sp. JS666]SDN47585.1 CNP1-like family protein [Polaromonas sp. JS666]